MQKQQVEPDMEKLTVSKLGKKYTKTVYCHSAYLTFMQSTVFFCCYEGNSTSFGCKVVTYFTTNPISVGVACLGMLSMGENGFWKILGPVRPYMGLT